jgi:hypothetical protein
MPLHWYRSLIRRLLNGNVMIVNDSPNRIPSHSLKTAETALQDKYRADYKHARNFFFHFTKLRIRHVCSHEQRPYKFVGYKRMYQKHEH